MNHPVPPKDKRRPSRTGGRKGKGQKQQSSLVESSVASSFDAADDRIHEDIIKALGSVDIGDKTIANARILAEKEYGQIGFPSHFDNSSIGNLTSEQGLVGLEGADIGYIGEAGQIQLGSKSRHSRHGSMIASLWEQDSELHHPLKLKLADQMGDNGIYYLPIKHKNRELKLDLNSTYEPYTSRSEGGVGVGEMSLMGEVMGTQSAREINENDDNNNNSYRQVPFHVKQRIRDAMTGIKEPLRGREIDISNTLMEKYTSNNKDSNENNIKKLTERVTNIRLDKKKQKSLNILRKKAILDGTYINDNILLGIQKHPKIIEEERKQLEYDEYLRNDDGSANYDYTMEPCYIYGIWSDSGPQINQCKAQLLYQKSIFRKRWLGMYR